MTSKPETYQVQLAGTFKVVYKTADKNKAIKVANNLRTTYNGTRAMVWAQGAAMYIFRNWV